MFGNGVSRWAPGFFGKILAYANAVEQGHAHPIRDLRDKVTDATADVARDTAAKTLTGVRSDTDVLPIKEVVVIKTETPVVLEKEKPKQSLSDVVKDFGKKL